jgi:hypothetical protein
MSSFETGDFTRPTGDFFPTNRRLYPTTLFHTFSMGCRNKIQCGTMQTQIKSVTVSKHEMQVSTWYYDLVTAGVEKVCGYMHWWVI